MFRTIDMNTSVFSLCKVSDAGVFAAASGDGGLRLIDTRLEKRAERIREIHNRPTTCVIPSASHESLFSLGLDGKICETDVRGRAAKVHEWGHPDLVVKYPMARIAIDPMGGFIAAGSEN